MRGIHISINLIILLVRFLIIRFLIVGFLIVRCLLVGCLIVFFLFGIAEVLEKCLFMWLWLCARN
jgi:hypothetical protein